ncbi:transposase [Sporolactobacillus inulinus]|uniref:Transposase n=1 Tax=Sporolactobacillus inulinus TaxID=2078 RepID=A0A4Y1Z8W7_9BACL|nr:transposase [Sporolactobacillus inulinus]
MKVKLRPRNRYISHEIADFIRPILKNYNEHFPETAPCLRGDS